MKRFITLFMLFSFLLSANLFAQQNIKKIEKNNISSVDERKIVHPSVIKKPIGFAVSGPLNKLNLTETDMEYNTENPFVGRERREASGKPNNIDYQEIYKNDNGMQLKPGWKDNFRAIIHNYDGQTTSLRPPDCTGEVGRNYYFQTININYAIYRKSDGVMVANGNLNSIFDPTLPGAGNNDGDPIVLYDAEADRWFYSEFSIAGANDYMLIAVSVTNDPTGNWFSWSFDVDDTPDYMKFGIQQDGYYMATNNRNGKDVYVFDRDAMLNGDPNPTMIGFDNPSRPATFDRFHCIMPLDNSRGDWAPANSHTRFITVADDGQGNPADELRIYNCTPDWNNPANSTFQLSQQIAVNAFSGEFDAANWDNIPQAGTNQQLDGVSTVLMYKAQYRNFPGDNEKIVAAHTIAETGTEGAIRWYILERQGGAGNWAIDQQGTYNPGGNNDDSRWLPGIAMNSLGQVALGYSESCTDNNNIIYPSIRVVGRSTCAPNNTMDIAEINIADGGTYQSGSNRWGDYTGMSVDPVDDYTFWFTTEYINNSHSVKHTKIAAFTFPNSCDPPVVTGVTPSSLYEDRGKQLTITGSYLSGCTFTIGGVTGTLVSGNASRAVVNFPPGNYTNGTLVVQNAAGSDNSHSVTVNTRNTIPVVAGSGVTSDNHPTIKSAIDGLYAWYGNTSFGAGDLPGAKTIVVHAGTYTEQVTLNSNLNPNATNSLTIENNSGDAVIVDASGNNYGFDLSTVPYVTLQGFAVHDADIANIYAQGNNVTIQYNKTYDSEESGIKIETGSNNTISNNLSYNNKKYGIEINSANNTVINNTLDGNGYAYSGPLTKTYTFSGSVAINDRTNAFADINVPDNVTITKVRVLNMNITHTYDADLDIYLRHPDATEVELSTDNGDNGDNYTNTNFDDNAATSITAGNAPFTGTFQPEGNLSTLNAKTSNGTWRLRVYDDSDGDQGTLTSWTLEITYNVNIEQGAGLYVGNVAATVKNNIIVAKTGNNNFYTLQSPGNSVSSQYNTYYTTNTNLFDYNGTQDNAGPMGTGDKTSDPEFVGNGDYHIFSTNDSYHGGEWPPTTATSGTWTADASDSPALDAGNPADAFGNEPASGNRINQGAYGNTVQASKSNNAVTLTWDGSTDNNWFDASNWTPAQVPSSSDNVIIADVTNQPIINNTIANIAQCNDMTINAGADITIDPNGYLTVNGSITNNAGTSGLVINSNDSGTGSLIQNTSGGVDATVYRRLSSTGRQWHMLASPIAAAPLTVFPSTNNLYYYDESTADYWTGTNYDAGSVMGWKTPAGNLVVGKGYAYNYFATTLTFTGQLNDNTSTSSLNITYHDHGTNAPNNSNYDNFDGWILLGNPYTSAIDWDDASVAHAAANINDAIYIYDDTNLHNYTSYVGGTGTNGGTRYIPAMQAFFVKATADGTLNIGANARTHNAQGFWKSTYTTQDNFIRLKITAENGYTDETVVRFSENATSGTDNGMDAYKLFTWEDYVPQIYTNAEGSINYSINTLKTFNENSVTIPLKLIQTGDKYTITVTEFNFKGYKVYLRDNTENRIAELGLNDILYLSSDESDSHGRYDLIFEKSASNILLAEKSNVVIYPNPAKGLFYLTVGSNKYYTVYISDITGKTIYNNKFFGNTSKMINLSNQSSGIYFVTVKFADNSNVIKKIVIE